MYAIIEDSGSQIRAEVGQELEIDLRGSDAKNVTFDKILLVSSDKGSTLGTPYVSGAKVEAEVLEADVKGKKIDVIKFKRRKGYRRKQGHRQRYMRVKVSAITGG